MAACPLRFAICGLEHSGTSLAAELFRQVPGLDAGFECGVLLGESPRALPTLGRWAEYMQISWGVTAADLARCCDTDDFATFYARLLPASRGLRPGTRAIFDKTPRYAANLPACLDRAAVPFVFLFKDPVATVWSDWRNAAEPTFDAWFEAYLPEKLAYAEAQYANFERYRAARDPRLCFVRLEELCLDTGRTAGRMFAHVGERFEPRYLAFREVRYANARTGSISAGIPFEHLADWPAERIARVRAAFARFEGWFFQRPVPRRWGWRWPR